MPIPDKSIRGAGPFWPVAPQFFPLTNDVLAVRLMRRRAELIEHVRQQLQRSDDPSLVSLARRLDDTGQRNVAGMLGDIDVAILGHMYPELRDVEQALKRIAEGTYGTCIDCGQAIDPQRLEVQPSASSCVSCKTAFEKRRGIAPGQVT